MLRVRLYNKRNTICYQTVVEVVLAVARIHLNDILNRKRLRGWVKHVVFIVRMICACSHWKNAVGPFYPAFSSVISF